MRMTCGCRSLTMRSSSSPCIAGIRISVISTANVFVGEQLERAVAVRCRHDLEVRLHRLFEHDAVRALVIDVEDRGASRRGGHGKEGLGRYRTRGDTNPPRLRVYWHLDHKHASRTAFTNVEGPVMTRHNFSGRRAGRARCRCPGGLVVKNGSNTRSRSSSGTPGPLSPTSSRDATQMRHEP